VVNQWLGLPGYRTLKLCTYSSGATLKPVDSEEATIARIVKSVLAAEQILAHTVVYQVPTVLYRSLHRAKFSDLTKIL
jgi:hypothetical protein